MRKLALYGAGALGCLLLELYLRCGASRASYDEVFYVDDGAAARTPSAVACTDFAGLLREAAVHDVSVAVCVGDPAARLAMAARVCWAGMRLAGLADSDARVSPRAELGEGCVVSGYSSVGPHARLAGNVLLVDAAVSHSCRVSEGSVLDARSALSRHVVVGGGAYVGVGAVLAEGAAVGEGARVGTGAVVAEGAAVGDRAVVGPGAVIGAGAVVGAGAIVGAGAVVADGAVVGAGAVVRAGAVVSGRVSDGRGASGGYAGADS